MEMYHYVVHSIRVLLEKFLESIFRFSHLLIRGLIKGLIPNWAIISTSSVEMYHCVVHNGSAPRGKF